MMSDGDMGLVPLDRIEQVEIELVENHPHGRREDLLRVQLSRALEKKVRASGSDPHGELNDDCVHITERRSISGPSRIYVARWMPRPGSPSQFLGGHCDGLVEQFSAGDDGFPPRVLNMGPREPIEGNIFDHAAKYTLVGFRNDSARWVYRAE